MPEGLYLYGVIPMNRKESFGPIGVGRRSPEVSTIVVQDLACVVSPWEEETVPATAQHAQVHERVLMTVFEQLPVLPFEFGTVAPEAGMVERLLRGNLHKFRVALRKLKGKAEMQLVACWHDMKEIFQEILNEHPAIARYKREISEKPADQTYQDRIRIGEMVASALAHKKGQESQKLTSTLKRGVLELTCDEPAGDQTVLRAACLVWKDRVSAFEQILNTLDQRFSQRFDVKYTGPLPCYHFARVPVRL